MRGSANEQPRLKERDLELRNTLLGSNGFSIRDHQLLAKAGIKVILTGMGIIPNRHPSVIHRLNEEFPSGDMTHVAQSLAEKHGGELGLISGGLGYELGITHNNHPVSGQIGIIMTDQRKLALRIAMYDRKPTHSGALDSTNLDRSSPIVIPKNALPTENLQEAMHPERDTLRAMFRAMMGNPQLVSAAQY